MWYLPHIVERFRHSDWLLAALPMGRSASPGKCRALLLSMKSLQGPGTWVPWFLYLGYSGRGVGLTIHLPSVLM
jgi:hypothetical protein